VKDNILNSILLAATFAAIVVSTIDFKAAPEATAARAERVRVMEKTEVVARRPPVDVAVTPADVAMVSLDRR